MKKGIGTLLLSCFVMLAIGQARTNEVQLFDNKVVVQLPAELKFLEKKEATNKVQHVYLNADKTVRFEIELSSQILEDNEIPDHTDKAISKIRSSPGGGRIIDDGISLNDGKNIGYFKFVTDDARDKDYHHIFYGSLEDRLINFSFSCPKEQRETWEKKIDMLVATLRIKDKILEE